MNSTKGKKLRALFAAVALAGALSACTSAKHINEGLLEHPDTLHSLQNLQQGTSKRLS